MDKQTVLLVDDDNSFLENMKKGVEHSIKNLKMITHTNAEDACKCLEENYISLLITDQNLPGMSGVELVNFVDKKYPRIPIILITAYGTPKLKNHAINTGAIKFFDKPVDLKKMAKEIKKGLQLSGEDLTSIRKMSLATVLELISMEKKTASIVVKDRKSNKSGRIWFDKGELIDAEIDDLEGIEAVFEMLPFGDVDIVVREREHDRITILDVSLEYVLLEGMKRIDENKITKKKEDTMALTEEVFDELSTTKGFVAAAVYLGNGEVIISKTAEKVPVQKMGGLAIELYKVAKDFAGKMNMGTTDFVEIHTENYKFIHTCVVPGVAAIGIIIASDGNVGLTKHNMSTIKADLKPDFEGKSISDFA
jgi:FixJ family two-component response regulator/predicted regulator of Ras-like GTPase activity (Roadblock/LC7/MglB family)